MLNDRVTIHLPEDILEGMLEYRTNQEFHLHLEGAGAFVLKVAEKK